MKRFFALIVALCVATLALGLLALSACSPDKDPNKIYVGMECGYAPFNYTQTDDSDGAVKISNAQGYANGYDVKIAKRIADELGKELVIVKYEWKALINAVITGSLDFIIAGMSPTAERLESIDFSDPYYESQLVVVVRKDGKYANATKLEDFGGATIVAQAGTFHDSALSAQAPNFNITRATPLDTFPLMINALNSKAVDGYVAEEPGAISDCASNGALCYVPIKNNTTGFKTSPEDTQIAVGLKKGSEFKEKINAALAKISEQERKDMMEKATELAS